jgi:hypothetical protein
MELIPGRPEEERGGGVTNGWQSPPGAERPALGQQFGNFNPWKPMKAQG